MNKWLAALLVLTASGCPDIQTDPDETDSRPLVEFDPGNSIVPFPNNLLLDPATGKVNLPASCNESASAKALREGVLNTLDGFGTFETAMSVTLTAPIDPATATDSVVLYKIASAGTPVDPATSEPVPVVVLPGSSIRFATQTRNADGTLTCSEPGPIDSITIVPRVPLDQKSTYVVAIQTGLKSADGVDYRPSTTWAIVRQAENPVTIDDNGNIISERTPLDPSTAEGQAQLRGIDLLYRAHKGPLDFLAAKGVERQNVLLGWSFNTQTTTDALDPLVAGTPLTALNDTPVVGPSDAVPVPISITFTPGVNLPASRAAYPFLACNTGAGASAPPEPNDVQCFLKISIGGGGACAAEADPVTACSTVFASGTAQCALLGCSNVQDVQVGRVSSPQFQINRPNPAVGSVCGPAMNEPCPVPGPWTDPVKPTKVEDEMLNALIFIPTGTRPAGGWPTVLFQHGLGASRTSLLALGGNLAFDADGAGTATSGFASIAIDAVAHGSRLVPVSAEASCATAPTAACFAGFLSPDLGTTRDNIRQTVVDQQQVIASIKKCTPASPCGLLAVDPAHIVYAGQSLGGILGSISTAISTDIQAGLLNVPGVGWADIFENTETLDIRCTLVDGLIDAGTLMGAKRDTMGTADPSDDTGLCIGQEWKTQPGYRQFAAIGRWVLDPADPANFTRKLATKTFLIQEVVGDQVVPNLATTNEGMLVGLTPGEAKISTSLTAPTPSPAITTAPTASKWVRYPTLAPDLGNGFPGNTYGHSSLLRPAPSVNATNPMTDQCTAATPQFCDGVLATVQMATDAITFLQINK